MLPPDFCVQDRWPPYAVPFPKNWMRTDHQYSKTTRVLSHRIELWLHSSGVPESNRAALQVWKTSVQPLTLTPQNKYSVFIEKKLSFLHQSAMMDLHHRHTGYKPAVLTTELIAVIYCLCLNLTNTLSHTFVFASILFFLSFVFFLSVLLFQPKRNTS